MRMIIGPVTVLLTIRVDGGTMYVCRKINLNRQPPEVNGVSIYFSEIKIRPRNCISYSF